MKFLSSYKEFGHVVRTAGEGGQARKCNPDSGTRQGLAKHPTGVYGVTHRSSLCLLYLREVSGSNLELRNFKEAMFSILNNQRAILSMQEELQRSRHLIEGITGALWERSPTGFRFLSGSNVPVALESRQWHTTTG